MLKEIEDFKLFKNKSKIFFIGIGGVSMSSIAMAFKLMGHEVSGYDAVRSELTSMLASKGIRVSFSFDRRDFDGIDAVICTNAISRDDPVYIYPDSLGIPIFTRAQALGFLMMNYPNPIGVAGTHGKSTTTGMLCSIFIADDRDPTVFSGAELPLIGGYYKLSRSDDFIFEACEYQDSFLSFFPKIAVVLNVAFDHPDYFQSLDDVISSFSRYISLAAHDGIAVVNLDDPGAVCASLGFSGLKWGFSVKDRSAVVFADNVASEGGFFSFDLVFRQKKLLRVRLGVPGKFNVSNALAACAAALYSGIDPKAIALGLEAFTGARRRFEIKGRLKDAVVVEDYAHHPDEINATLSAARSMGFDRIAVVFQPHTFTRTRACWDDICRAFENGCDRVIYADVFPARERPIENIDARHLALCTSNGEYSGDLSSIASKLKKEKNFSGLLIIMGAGDINALTGMLLEGNDEN